MNEGTGTGYSLWLMPRGALAEKLRERIHILARTYGGPEFEPHVTLAGDTARSEEDAVDATVKITRRLAPFALHLSRPDHQDVFFRSFYLRIRQDMPVMRAGYAAGQGEGYFPHLSLFYGRLPQDVREALCAKPYYAVTGTFSAASVHLFRTHGPCADWVSIGEYPLKG